MFDHSPQQTSTVVTESGAHVVICLEAMWHVDLKALLLELQMNKETISTRLNVDSSGERCTSKAPQGAFPEEDLSSLHDYRNAHWQGKTLLLSKPKWPAFEFSEAETSIFATGLLPFYMPWPSIDYWQTLILALFTNGIGNRRIEPLELQVNFTWKMSLLSCHHLTQNSKDWDREMHFTSY